MSNNNRETNKWIKLIQATTAGIAATAALLTATLGLINVFDNEISSEKLPKVDSADTENLRKLDTQISQYTVNNNAQTGDVTNDNDNKSTASSSSDNTQENNTEVEVNIPQPEKSGECSNTSTGDYTIQNCNSDNSRSEINVHE